MSVRWPLGCSNFFDIVFRVFCMRTLQPFLCAVCLFFPAFGPADAGHAPREERQAQAPKPKLKILIHKAKKKLEMWEGEKQLHEFRVVFGNAPEGSKLRRGDMKTPEGVYYVRVKNSKSQFYLSLGLSYPERRDAKRALEEKQISKAQYEKIIQAHNKKQRPPSNTPLGGEIFIHGGGASGGENWTHGCIALDNADMKLLFDKTPLGSEVEILP
ncbi:MAG: L,D-transpeptidase [Proteobacteria bacterium]|nr:L,D-transpeptidase [Cystobacterineae bacterium]MCL2259335.1 L,D-transpeptidase [Cystobacterineae bacterium]MCL2314878.1 L,D-transpeptidase [Pseudomonadota bacterium]